MTRILEKLCIKIGMLIVVWFLLWHMAWHGSDTNENAVFIIIIY